MPARFTISALKRRLFKDKLTNLPAPAQKLIGKSKVINNRTKVTDVIDANKSSKFMLLRDHSYVPSEINLRLLMPNLRARALDTFAAPTTTVQKLKQILEECHAFPAPRFYSLFLNGVELVDEKQLKAYCLDYSDRSKSVELQVVPKMQIKLSAKTKLVKGKCASPPPPASTPVATAPTDGQAQASVNASARARAHTDAHALACQLADMECNGAAGSARAPTPAELHNFFAAATGMDPSPGARSQTAAPTASASASSSASASARTEANPLVEVNTEGGVSATGVTAAAAASAPPTSNVPASFRTGFGGPPTAIPAMGGAGAHGLTSRDLSKMDHVTISTEMEVDWPSPAVLQPATDRSRAQGAALALIQDEMSRNVAWTNELQSMIKMCLMTGGRGAHFLMEVPRDVVCRWALQLLEERKSKKQERENKRRQKAGPGTGVAGAGSSSASKDSETAPAMSKGFLDGLYDSAEKRAERRKAKAAQRRKEKAAVVASEAVVVAQAAAAAAKAASLVAKKAAKKKKKPKKFKSLMAGLMKSSSKDEDSTKGCNEKTKQEISKANPKIEFSKLERI